jgi:hypothetical protein
LSAGPVGLQRRPDIAPQGGILADRFLEVLDRLELTLAAAKPGNRWTIRIR